MSTPQKRPTKKSKFLTDDLEDFLESAKLTKESVKTKKAQKKQRVQGLVDEELSDIAEPFPSSSKKPKVGAEVETGKIVQDKLIKAMENQRNTRQEGYNNMVKKLSEVMSQMKADNAALKSNQQKLVHLTSSVIKCMEQVGNALDQKLIDLTEIATTFKKEFEEIDSDQKAETNELAAELRADIQKLQEKLVTETKRNSLETLRKTIFQAMHNDI